MAGVWISDGFGDEDAIEVCYLSARSILVNWKNIEARPLAIDALMLEAEADAGFSARADDHAFAVSFLTQWLQKSPRYKAILSRTNDLNELPQPKMNLSFLTTAIEWFNLGVPA